MPSATKDDVEKQRFRIKAAYRLGEISRDTRDSMLECSKVMARYRSTWGYNRQESVLKRLIMLAWGGTKYDPPEASLSDALDDKEAAGEIVEWINDHYQNEETNRDMRGALRTFGKVLTNEDATDKDATPPPSIEWISSTLPSNYNPLPNPANMIKWPEVKEMCDHPKTNARNAALLAVAWDAGFRSGELESLTVGDVADHEIGKIIHVDGKTGERDVTVTNAVPYLRQWINQHPAGDSDPDAPLWSKLTDTEDISYRMYRRIFRDAAARVDLDKPNDPTNFRKSSASALASRNVSQAHLEKRYGWKRGSDAAARYIRVFGEDADRELAKARGMDVEWEPEDESEGPTDCERCGVLIDAEAVKCDNCGFIQDREKAINEIDATSGTNIENLIRGAVRETVGDMFGVDAGSNIGERSDAGLTALAILSRNDELPDPDNLDDILAELDASPEELREVEVPTTATNDDAPEWMKERRA